MDPAGLEAVFLANRDRLLRFLAAHGAGDAAEDLLQDLWLKVSAARTGPVASPLSYLFRAANNLMVDRHRAERQAAARERAWGELTGGDVPGRSDAPAPDRAVVGRARIAEVEAALSTLGERTSAIFRRHRLDGVGQRAVAEEFGVSLSTVEADLRRAYRALIELKGRWDEA